MLRFHIAGNCISESDANYEGSLVQSLRGQKFSQGDCCSACYNTTGCNVWVWCPAFEVSGRNRMLPGVCLVLPWTALEYRSPGNCQKHAPRLQPLQSVLTRHHHG